LREHEIFERPHRIDRSQMISIPTPEDFRAEIKDDEIKVLPIVTDQKRAWSAGWCTHAREFANYPEVEFFCGGVNHQTPTSASIWRQGNLLHFGFEQSPTEMYKSGQALLLNSIAYISRFTEDRPIAVTPSVFAGPVARPRDTVPRWLRIPNRPDDWIKELVAPQVWTTMSKQKDREAKAKWADENARYLYPNSDQLLAMDEDLVAMGIPFDRREFVEKAIADLRSHNNAIAMRAIRLLHRYLPMGPKNDAADAWQTWWKENQLFAFWSDAGDYRWYIDPLAKRRGIASSELRGPRRADQR